MFWVGFCPNLNPIKHKYAGFFTSQKTEEEQVFKLAIENINYVNQDKNFPEDSLILEPYVEHVLSFDSYNTSRRVCTLASQGIGGIFGLHSTEAIGIAESTCDAMDIPLIKAYWDASSMPSKSVINIYPDPKILSKVLVDVIEDMDWTSYAILYDSDYGLLRLQELLKSHKRAFTSEGHVPFTVWQIEPEGDVRPILKHIQKTSETRIVLDCATERIIDVLKQAKQVKMLGDYHSYVLTSLDAHTLDYSELQLSDTTNITTLRLVNPQRHYVQSTVQDWVFFHKNLLEDKVPITADTLKTNSALMFDAIKVYSEAVQRIRKSSQEEVKVMPLECSQRDKWLNGSLIINEIKKVKIEGMSGSIKFDESGQRTFFSIDITELTKNGFRKIGTWDPEIGISYTRTGSQMQNEMFQSISNKTFYVVSRLGEPYLKEVDKNLEGNARYAGYAMDLIDEIAKDLKFSYKFYLAPDGEYGSFNKETKQWTGLIKELRERRADLGICDLTINYERRSAVDFTMPFMTLGISILYSKPMKQPPELFSFLSPFSVDVWIYMATAYLGVSLLLYFLARCTPDEWDNPHPCNPDPTELECTFSLHNCLWFSIGSLMAQGCDLLPKISPMEWKNPHPCNKDPEELENTLAIYNAIWHNIGSLMQQGSDIAPQALSTRVVAGMWWFFVLIMISSYTANLAAFLTMDRMEATIENVEDLANQNKIKYGLLKKGSSANFFKNSNVSLYQKIWSQMESAHPSVFTSDNDEGVERVLRGNRAYAFFMESTTIEYQKEKHCSLMQVGGLLDSKGYGIAMPFNSPYRIAISGSVLKMQESGKLQQLKDKWWKNQKDKCPEEDKSKDSSELSIAHVGGVFLVLLVGCVVAFFMSILEFLWNVRKVAVEEKISPGEAFLLELKFAIQCYGTTKPVWKRREDSVVGKDFPESHEIEEVEEEEEDRGFFGDENMEEEYIRMNGFNKNIRAMSTQSYS
ncbi:glutamate receptor ionotropic, kainate 2 isoform X2 [Halyomorpha halys]|uniref:glutamate receptor ionotropic, kainate 2 isoform X2 n=1 Tax=Halyomorpha halys TaxID=286706 RepID=UPI0006D4F859|nr:glutamate receptor ionotropic, kainate 2-like isoform X2 [Halyomorpha halys]